MGRVQMLDTGCWLLDSYFLFCYSLFTSDIRCAPAFPFRGRGSVGRGSVGRVRRSEFKVQSSVQRAEFKVQSPPDRTGRFKG